MRRRRGTVLRGHNVDTTATSMGELSTGDKVESDSGAPKGYKPLDATRSYSLVSKAYLIEGKVSVSFTKLLVIVC